MVFLNMKQVKKEIKENDNNNTKITKLAIGKPGGADFSGEEWELQLKMRCLMCNIDVDYTQDVIFLDDLIISYAKPYKYSRKIDFLLNYIFLIVLFCRI